MSDPTQIDADARPARFLRLVKGSYIPSTDVHDFADRQAAFGLNRTHSMREILGYVPIEPDGSVLTKVPANVPFAISVVDKDGRRLGGRHQNWLQLQSGEVLECNGCHDRNPLAPANPLPHGYSDDPVVLNMGAPVAGVAFTGTDPLVLPELNDTMALTRIRTACGPNASGALGLNVAIATCSALSPKLDMRFTDVWTDPAGAPTPDLDILYGGLATTLPSVDLSINCSATWIPWDPGCRAIINYEAHIHPLWAAARAGGACTACHDVAGAVTAGQLDLSDGPSDLESNHFKAYRELLSADTAVDAAGDPITQDATTPPLFNPLIDPITGLPVIDPITGLVVLDPTSPRQVPVQVAASMSTNGAISSGSFFDRFFTGSGDADHENQLTQAEIRLLSEWLDMGAQYYNRPFDAPQN